MTIEELDEAIQKSLVRHGHPYGKVYKSLVQRHQDPPLKNEWNASVPVWAP